MKKDVHPKYYPNAKVKCVCGNTFEVGATVPEIEIEICSKCHPFYTGKEKIIDTAGRVDKFKKRLEKKTLLEKEGRVAKKTKKAKKESGKKKILNKEIK
ncbi:MAG: 50S ribosomal protein L31 [Minisyncoccia bacterium]